MRAPRDLIDPPPAPPRTHLPIQIGVAILLGLRDVVGPKLGVYLALILPAGQALMPGDVVQVAGALGAPGAAASDDGFVEAVVVDLALGAGVQGAPAEGRVRFHGLEGEEAVVPSVFWR
ncbi:hypothetical protein FGG08_006995 [Glutinoglossum americanum]|uniref:Uncharacterized protein n=1 Tax=Glutinoglossum americanum TaxID=1670608 RepID=A0A9P8HUW5_9PEZI|nr:hypothetical protein FGG08_006995 [Glutinoglossum americanum]